MHAARRPTIKEMRTWLAAIVNGCLHEGQKVLGRMQSELGEWLRRMRPSATWLIFNEHITNVYALMATADF